MSLKQTLLCLLLMSCIAGPTQLLSQEKLVLTLDKSVSLALERNPQIRMAEKEVAKAKAGVWEAYSNILPQLDATASLQHAWEIQQTTIPNFLKPMLAPLAPFIPELSLMPDYVRLSFALENTYTYGATLRQPLFLGGAGVAGIEIAYAAKSVAERNLEANRQNLIYQTANAFYGVLLARELVSVQEEALAQAQANLDVVLKKHEVGMASGFDKMRAEVEAANIKPEVITARNQYQSALTQFRTVLGLDRDTVIEVEGAFAYAEDEFSNMPLEDFQTLALTKRPEILALADQKYMAEKATTIARSNFMPKLFFSTDYSYLAQRNDYKISQRDFSKGFTSALSLQIPIFHGFKSSKEYQRAKLDYRIVLDTEKQAHDGIAAESEIAYNSFQEAKQKYVSAKESVDLAQEALRLANMMYEEGANTQLDVLNSRLALTRAQLNYISSLYEYQMARYQLRKVTGSLTGAL